MVAADDVLRYYLRRHLLGGAYKLTSLASSITATLYIH
jgi:hypothetical protein